MAIRILAWILVIVLDAMYFYLWLGPKSGEGFVHGWANAFGMFAINLVMAVISLTVGIVMFMKREWVGQLKPLLAASMATILVTFVLFLING